jgi:hypothetical protein
MSGGFDIMAVQDASSYKDHTSWRQSCCILLAFQQSAQQAQN